MILLTCGAERLARLLEAEAGAIRSRPQALVEALARDAAETPELKAGSGRAFSPSPQV